MNISKIYNIKSCPKCGTMSKKHSVGIRKVKCLGIIKEIKHSKHYCPTCRKIFSVGYDGAQRCRLYSDKLINKCVQLVKEGNSFTNTSKIINSKYRTHVPISTIHGWVIEHNEKYSL